MLTHRRRSGVFKDNGKMLSEREHYVLSDSELITDYHKLNNTAKIIKQINV